MASQTPIFRTITVAHGQTVTLGEPIPADVLPLTEPDGPNQYKMIDGDFGGASSIVIGTGAGQAVTFIAFAYADGTVYSGMVSAFERELGAPQSQSGESVVWQDTQTQFALYNTSPINSQLTDLAS